MNNQLVFARTDKGNDELNARTYRLPRQLRTVLILVDGKSSLAQLRVKAMGLRELEGSLEDLAMNGFIKPNSRTWPRPMNSGTTGPLFLKMQRLFFPKIRTWIPRLLWPCRQKPFA